MGGEVNIPGVYQETQELEQCIDLPEEEVGTFLLELAKDHDLMLLSPSTHTVGKYNRLIIDSKGGGFRKR